MNTHAIRTAVATLLLLATLASSRATAATPQEDSRFLAAARKAFADRDAGGLSKLTCWDHVPEKLKATSESGYALLLETRDVTFDLKLVDADRPAVAAERKVDGKAERTNLPVSKRIDVTIVGIDKKILGVIGFPVGEKDGQLLLAGFAPVP